jgi:hypothetical protein
MFGDVSYEAPAQFPYTTEKFLKDLPLAPTSRVGQVAGQAASFVPLNPMPAVRGVQKIGQMAGEELAATMMGQRPNSMMSKVVPQPLFAVAPEQGLLSTKVEPIESLLQVKPQAPVSDIGFYSATEQAALNLGRNKGTGQSFINDLMKAPDVKKEELAYTGLDDFLRDKPNVTKQEVQDFLANNRVDVKEIRKSDTANTYSAYGDDADGYFVYDPNGSREVAGPFKTMYEAEDKADRLTLGAAPKYEKYQLAGGNNYREILLTLPNQWEKPRAAQTANEARIQALRQEMYGTSGTDEIRSEISRLRNENTELQKQISEAPIYTSSHFDEPNILAHMRVNDRVDADGKKMLLVEEIQSDWHQAGREKGYKGKGTLKELPENYFVQEIKTIDGDTMYVVRNKDNPSVVLNKDYNKQSAINGVVNELNASSAGGVPDAPFKDTWYQLALKRLTKYAAENGYERIGLTTGKQQAERFDLSQQIGQINARPTPDGKIALEAMTPDMRNQVFNKVVNADELDGIVGKEIAEKIKNQIEYPKSFDDRGKSVELSGLDLQVGGEGMKKYYDEIYPKFLDKYGKKYGASVGETKIKTDSVPYVDYVVKQGYFNDHTVFGVEPNGTTTVINQNAANMAEAQALANRYKEKNLGGGETIRYLDITPQMKEGTSKGQPLFAATPLLPATSLLDEEKRKEITSLLE